MPKTMPTDSIIPVAPATPVTSTAAPVAPPVVIHPAPVVPPPPPFTPRSGYTVPEVISLLNGFRDKLHEVRRGDQAAFDDLSSRLLTIENALLELSSLQAPQPHQPEVK